MPTRQPEPHNETDRLIMLAAERLIAMLTEQIGADAIHRYGPYAGVWEEMRRIARTPLHIRVGDPQKLATQLAAAGAPGSAPSIAVLTWSAMITLLIDRQHFAGEASRAWYQKLIDQATEIADRSLGPTEI